MRFFKLMAKRPKAIPLVSAAATCVMSPDVIIHQNYEALKTAALAHERRRVDSSWSG
jgi:hypothetical protein